MLVDVMAASRRARAAGVCACSSDMGAIMRQAAWGCQIESLWQRSISMLAFPHIFVRIAMEKIEITTPEPDKARLVLQDAIERHKHLLTQSITCTQGRVQQLASQLHVDLDLLQAGQAPHPENQDMDLLELEGELEILRHLQEQVETLTRLTLCP